MKNGRRLEPSPSVTDLRDMTMANLARLPDGLRSIDRDERYGVTITDSVRDLAAKV
jgi:hypothetical protein